MDILTEDSGQGRQLRPLINRHFGKLSSSFENMNMSMAGLRPSRPQRMTGNDSAADRGNPEGSASRRQGCGSGICRARSIDPVRHSPDIHVPRCVRWAPPPRPGQPDPADPLVADAFARLDGQARRISPPPSSPRGHAAGPTRRPRSASIQRPRLARTCRGVNSWLPPCADPRRDSVVNSL
jgi:hypothetical protein